MELINVNFSLGTTKRGIGPTYASKVCWISFSYFFQYVPWIQDFFMELFDGGPITEGIRCSRSHGCSLKR